MTTLIFVRHGVTEENLNYTLIGHTNPPLHPYGLQQADAVAKTLRTTPLSAVLTSPLLRCVQTAEKIVEHHKHAAHKALDGLTEIHLGVVDGMSSFTAYEKHQAMLDEALDETALDFGFPNGELRSAVLHRFSSCVEHLVRTYPNGHVCVVTHGGPLGLWLANLHGDPLGRFRRWQPKHASITRVSSANYQFQVDVHNDTTHLPPELSQTIQQAHPQIST